MALSKAYGKLTDWAIITVVIFAVLIFGGVFIAKTVDVSEDITTGTNFSTNITDLGNDYFDASSELSTVVVTIISFVILAALLILLFYFIRFMKDGGSGGDMLI